MLLNNRHKFQKWKFAQCNLELTTDSKVKIFHKSSNSSCRKIAICIQLFEQLEALVYVTKNHRTFAITEYCHSRLPIMAPFMSGKSRVRKYENIVWITILSASLNKSDIRCSIVLHVVECECIKHVYAFFAFVLRYQVLTMRA